MDELLCIKPLFIATKVGEKKKNLLLHELVFGPLISRMPIIPRRSVEFHWRDFVWHENESEKEPNCANRKKGEARNRIHHYFHEFIENHKFAHHSIADHPNCEAMKLAWSIFRLMWNTKIKQLRMLRKHDKI